MKVESTPSQAVQGLKAKVLQVLGVTFMMVRPIIRNPIWHVVISIIPLSYVLIFGILGGVNLAKYAIVGALIALSMNSGIVSLPQVVVYLKNIKLQEMFVASPVDPYTYCLGIALSRLFYVMPELLLFLLLGASLNVITLSEIPIIVSLVLCSWIIGCTIGYTVSTYVDKIMYISAVSNLLGLLLMLLPPVYYPAEFLPQQFRFVVYLVPSATVAQLLRLYLGISSWGNKGVLWGLILLQAAIFSLSAAVKSRWRYS